MRSILKIRVHSASSIPHLIGRLEPKISMVDFGVHRIDKSSENNGILGQPCLVRRIIKVGSRKFVDDIASNLLGMGKSTNIWLEVVNSTLSSEDMAFSCSAIRRDYSLGSDTM